MVFWTSAAWKEVPNKMFPTTNVIIKKYIMMYLIRLLHTIELIRLNLENISKSDWLENNSIEASFFCNCEEFVLFATRKEYICYEWNSINRPIIQYWMKFDLHNLLKTFLQKLQMINENFKYRGCPDDGT